MSVNGRDGQEPMRAAMPISDLVAGLYGAFGAVCALVARRGGRVRGQRVESSMVNGLISLMAYLSANYLATGQLPARTGNEHPIAAPYGLYGAADGEVAIAPSTDGVVRRLFRALRGNELPRAFHALAHHHGHNIGETGFFRSGHPREYGSVGTGTANRWPFPHVGRRRTPTTPEDE